MATALALAVGLILLGVTTGVFQVRGQRRLAARRHVPSDEFAYLRGRYRRRLLTAALLVAIGGMIGGAYLSGLERRADNLGEPKPGEADQPPAQRKMTDDEKQLFRFWSGYWIIVVVLVFALTVLATLDAWSTRRYWLSQYRALREDHEAKLRRDLAVYRQQKEQTRGGRISGKRLGDADKPEA
jgi:hypothetical protein